MTNIEDISEMNVDLSFSCYGLDGGIGGRSAFQNGWKLSSVGLWQTGERNFIPIY
jgi:hypothetical protein